jgi:hypothetical protein
MHDAFMRNMRGAKRRGIEFKFTFEDWANAWLERGRWYQRGKEAHEYVMGRFDDQGAYEVGNVEIITFTQNVQDGNLGRVQTEEHKSKRREAQIATRAEWSTEKREAHSAAQSISQTAAQKIRWAKVSSEDRQAQHQKMRVGYDAAKVKPK